MKRWQRTKAILGVLVWGAGLMCVLKLLSLLAEHVHALAPVVVLAASLFAILACFVYADWKDL